MFKNKKKVLKMRKVILSAFLAFSCSIFCCEPYDSTEVLPFDGHGWFANANSLDQIIQKNKPIVAIEVGSWLGASTRFIAERVAKVYAVDTWCGSPLEAVHMNDPRLPHLYQQFLSNTIHAGLTDRIIPIRMNSLEAAKALRGKVDLIYLDAAHDTNSVIADILAWYPHLRKGGVMCGDDWSWPTVREAVVHCSRVLNKKIDARDHFWSFVD